MACTTVSTDVGFPYNYLFIGTLNISFIIPIPIICILIYKIRALLEDQKLIMSEKTYSMHKELFKTLIFQFLVPGGTIFIPYTIMMSLIIFNTRNMAVVFQVTYEFGTLHSTMNTVMMVCFIKPYRHKFIQKFWNKPKQVIMKKYKFHISPLIRNNNAVYFVSRYIKSVCNCRTYNFRNNSSSYNPSQVTHISTLLPELSVAPVKSVLQFNEQQH